MPSKLLYLLRHAKAESSKLKLSDLDRTLTDRGVGDAQKLAAKLRKKEIAFNLIVASPAVRAITTAQIIAKTLDFRQSHLEVNESLYQANSSDLLELVAGLHKKASKVLLVGHNPGMEEFAQLLSGEPISMATCSLIEFDLDIKHWKDIEKIKHVQVKLIH